MTHPEADALLDRVCGGHALPAAEGAQLRAYVHAQREEPGQRLVGLVGDIRVQLATTGAKADTALEAHADVSPVLARLAQAEAARAQAEADAMRRAQERAERASARLWDLISGALGQRALGAMLTLLLGAVAGALGISWTH